MKACRSAKHWGKVVGAIFAATAMAGCSGGGGGGGGAEIGGAAGSLTLKLIDAPVRDASEIKLTISNLSLKPQGDGPALDFPLDPPLEVDLLTLTPENAATLLDGVDVPVGEYDWLAMDVAASFDGRLEDGSVTTTAGGMEELQVPSGRVRLVSGLTITANQPTSLMIDWDVRRGLVRPPGHQGGFLLRPAFRVVDMTAFGTLAGTVAAETLQDASCGEDNADDLSVGNAIYVFAHPAADPTASVTPDDIDGVDPDPVATFDVEPDGANGYAFHTLLSAGAYTLAFTCEADNDDPEVDDSGTDSAIAFVATADVTIDDGGEQSVDF